MFMVLCLKEITEHYTIDISKIQDNGSDRMVHLLLINITRKTKILMAH